MTDEKQEQPIEEPEDLKFVNQLFERLEKKSLPELIEGFERGFYRSGVTALEIFKELCLKGSNSKKQAEAAKYLLSFLKDPNFIKNMALVHELRGRLSKDAATADNKATWKTEPKQE